MAPSTKLALANALKAQLQKKFLDDITVKELVEACEINRQTFYYHFQDIYDLLRWLLEHETGEALGGAEDWQAALLDAFCYIRDNHMVIYHIYRSAGRDNLLDCPFYSLARAIASASLEREARELRLPEADADFLTDFYTSCRGAASERLYSRMYWCGTPLVSKLLREIMFSERLASTQEVGWGWMLISSAKSASV